MTTQTITLKLTGLRSSRTESRQRVTIRPTWEGASVFQNATHYLELATIASDCDVVVTIDVREIAAHVAALAARNKSGRAVMLRGKVKAKRTAQRILSETIEPRPIPANFEQVQP